MFFVTAWSMDEYAEEKRTEKILIVRSGLSEAETTNNKRLRSTYCIEAIRHEASRGLFATAELFVPPYGSPIILVLPASNIFTKF